MTQLTTSYKCDICGLMFDTQWQAESHEEDCMKKRTREEQQRLEYLEKVEKRTAEALEIVRKSDGIRLLVENGLLDDARTLCRDKVRFLWDCGTSSGWETLYTRMIQVYDKSYTRD